MALRSTSKVFCFLYSIAGILSLSCGMLHLFGFTDDNEPTRHQALFVITYFGFLLTSSYGIFNLSRGNLCLKIETLSAACGFFMFNTTSIKSMVDVKNDPHLPHMNDLQASMHPYLIINRVQSVLSLTNVFFYLRLTLSSHSQRPGWKKRRQRTWIFTSKLYGVGSNMHSRGESILKVTIKKCSKHSMHSSPGTNKEYLILSV